MGLTSAQQKRLIELGEFLIEEGFSDYLVKARLMPAPHFFDRWRASVLVSGTPQTRFVNFLRKVGPCGQAFAFFVVHRPDLFSEHLRNACNEFVGETVNQLESMDSIRAGKILAKLDESQEYDTIPFLVTPFASYYRSKDRVAKLVHNELVGAVESDVAILHKVLSEAVEGQAHNEHSQFLVALAEFAEFISDYYSPDSHSLHENVIKKSKEGVVMRAALGTTLSSAKKILKKNQASSVANAILAKWLESVFVQRRLLYDLQFWEWNDSDNLEESSGTGSASSKISFIDVHPVVTITEKEKKILLTFFTAIYRGDEQTAAACIINMCEHTDSSLDLAERLVSDHRAELSRRRHTFEIGIKILEAAADDGMTVKPQFARVVASASQAILLIRQYVPHNTDAFTQFEALLAEHDVKLQLGSVNDAQDNATIAAQPNSSNSSYSSNEVTMKQPEASVPVSISSSAELAMDRLAKEIDKSSNRIAYSAIIAAFTIAGALLISSAGTTGMLLLGVPFFLIAFFTALLLISSIVKEPK